MIMTANEYVINVFDKEKQELRHPDDIGIVFLEGKLTNPEIAGLIPLQELMTYLYENDLWGEIFELASEYLSKTEEKLEVAPQNILLN